MEYKYPKFAHYKLLNYYCANPHMNVIKAKMWKDIGDNFNKFELSDIDNFRNFMSSRKKTIVKAICVRTNQHKQFIAIQLDYLKRYPKDKAINITYSQYLPVEFNNKFVIINKDYVCPTIDDEMNEYLLKNFNYQGVEVENMKIKVWGSNIKYISEQFRVPFDKDEIGVQKLIGETDKKYHFIFNSHSFFLYKNECEDFFKKRYSMCDFTPDYINENYNWDEWKANGYKMKQHQIDGAKFLITNKRGLISDKTGIGKSLQAMAATMYVINNNLVKSKSHIIVTIANDKDKWGRECERLGLKYRIAHGKAVKINKKNICSFRTTDIIETKEWNLENESRLSTAIFDKLTSKYDVTFHVEIDNESFDTTVDNFSIKRTKNKNDYRYVIVYNELVGNDEYDEFEGFSIVNYDILNSFSTHAKAAKFFKIKFGVAIIDEGHKAKEPKTGQSKVIQKVCNIMSQYVFALTATPFEKNINVYTLFSNLGMYENKLIPDNSNWNLMMQMREDFIIRYCGGYKDSQWMKIKGKAIVKEVIKFGKDGNSYELGQRIKHKFLRRTENDVEGFPELNEYPMWVELNGLQRIKYNEIIAEVLADPKYKTVKYEANPNGEIIAVEKDIKGVQQIVSDMRLRQYTAIVSLKTTVNHALMKIRKGKKVIIFTQFKEEFEELKKMLDIEGVNHVYVNSNQSLAWERKYNHEIVDHFNKNKEVEVIFGNKSTLGTAHNIASADGGILNLDYSNVYREQPIGRAWRLNKVGGSVFAAYTVIKDTIMEKVYLASKGKKDNINILFGEY
jgi:superfamily II DNA or RNA helicase